MEASNHKFSEFLEQLGLPGDAVGIDQFITSHSPLKGDVKLVDAPFWNEAQRSFLRDCIHDDADWALPFDQLNEALRRPRK